MRSPSPEARTARIAGARPATVLAAVAAGVAGWGAEAVRGAGWRLTLLVPVAVAACKGPLLPESTTDVGTASTAVDWGAFTLGPNDLVHVSVLGQPELSSPSSGIRVAPDGSLSMPLLGAVPVNGLSAEEARRVIEAGLGEYLKKPSVSVSVVEYSSRRFYLFGEVKKPGPYAMDRPITALEALTFGEGLASGAFRERAVIVRRHGANEVEVIPFNAEVPGPDGLVQVRPDDFLFVAKSRVGNFSEDVMPYLQGLGFTLSQVASIALAYDRLYNEE
jgi:polysaccharide export outer membrane protein